MDHVNKSFVNQVKQWIRRDARDYVYSELLWPQSYDQDEEKRQYLQSDEKIHHSAVEPDLVVRRHDGGRGVKLRRHALDQLIWLQSGIRPVVRIEQPERDAMMLWKFCSRIPKVVGRESCSPELQKLCAIEDGARMPAAM